MNQGTGAYNTALAWESASDSRYDQVTEEYRFTADELERYARIVAYKVAHNLKNGWTMDPDMDPLTYIDCGKNNE